jgi:hypothetical protein
MADITARLAAGIARKSDLDRDKDLMRDALREIERLREALTKLASNEVEFSPEGDWQDEALAMAAFAAAALCTNKGGGDG